MNDARTTLATHVTHPHSATAPVRRLEPRLTVRAVRPLVATLRELGHDPTPILKSIGVDEATLSDPDARVPMSVGIGFLAGAVEHTGDLNLGLHLAQRVDPRSFEVHFYAMLSSATLGAAYECLCRYQRLIHETSRVELTIDKEQVVLRHHLLGKLPVPRQTAEFIVTSWVRVGRLITGVDWAPLEVRFAHSAPPDSKEHRDFFRASVLFSRAENALVLPAPLLETPCTRADAALAAVMDGYAADRLLRAPRANSLADRVRTAIEDELRGGQPTGQRVAARLKMSVRTLNRLLAKEGTSYRTMLAVLRQALATRHLTDDEMSISEIAFLLGFSEHAAFHRAFKRWTGLTPSSFRNQQRRR